MKLDHDPGVTIAQVVNQWIDAHWPKKTDPAVCRHCGAKDENLIPMGYGPRPAIWLHRDCWEAFRAALRIKAKQAMGFEE